MEVEILVDTEGKVSFFVREGTFAEARQKLERLIEELKATGLEFAEEGQVERHRHDNPVLEKVRVR